MVNLVVIRVNLESLEDTHHGRLVVRVERAEVTHRHGHLVASRVRAVVDQERVERAEDGVQVHLVVIHINLAMVEDTQMEEEDTIQDTTDMAVTLAAAVGLPAANLARAEADHLGLLAVRVGSRALDLRGQVVERAASLEDTHLLRQAHGIHLEVVTLNLLTPNLPTVVVLKMMGTGTLVDMGVNGTRGHLHHQARGHLVASRGRAEVALAHRGVHPLRVNLASLDTDI